MKVIIENREYELPIELLSKESKKCLAIQMRQNGYTAAIIGKRLETSQQTISNWTKGISVLQNNQEDFVKSVSQIIPLLPFSALFFTPTSSRFPFL